MPTKWEPRLGALFVHKLKRPMRARFAEASRYAALGFLATLAVALRASTTESNSIDSEAHSPSLACLAFSSPRPTATTSTLASAFSPTSMASA